MIKEKWKEITQKVPELSDPKADIICDNIDLSFYQGQYNITNLYLRNLFDHFCEFYKWKVEKGNVNYEEIERLLKISKDDRKKLFNKLHSSHHGLGIAATSFKDKEDEINLLNKLFEIMYKKVNIDYISITGDEINDIKGGDIYPVNKREVIAVEFIEENIDNIFIPLIQRAYVYGEKEIIQIIESIEKGVVDFGIIQTNLRNGMISIIDGKQRVITFILFLIVLQKSKKNIEDIKFITDQEKVILKRYIKRFQIKDNYRRRITPSLFIPDSFWEKLSKVKFTVISHLNADEFSMFYHINNGKRLETKDLFKLSILSAINNNLNTELEYKEFNELMTSKFEGSVEKIFLAASFETKLHTSIVKDKKIVSLPLRPSMEGEWIHPINNYSDLIIESLRRMNISNTRSLLNMAKKISSINLKYLDRLLHMSTIISSYVQEIYQLSIIMNNKDRKTINFLNEISSTLFQIKLYDEENIMILEDDDSSFEIIEIIENGYNEETKIKDLKNAVLNFSMVIDGIIIRRIKETLDKNLEWKNNISKKILELEINEPFMGDPEGVLYSRLLNIFYNNEDELNKKYKDMYKFRIFLGDFTIRDEVDYSIQSYKVTFDEIREEAKDFISANFSAAKAEEFIENTIFFSSGLDFAEIKSDDSMSSDIEEFYKKLEKMINKIGLGDIYEDIYKIYNSKLSNLPKPSEYIKKIDKYYRDKFDYYYKKANDL